MAVLARAFAYGLGVAYGLLVIALLYALKQAVVEPALEWLWEFWEQHFVDRVPEETRVSEYSGMREIVVVSDLHIDTWERAPETRGARERRFFEFLAAIEPTTMEFYINGDLLDAPPNPEDAWSGAGVGLKGSILPKYEGVLAALGELNNQQPAPVPVTILYGNHDMAASGLRYDLVKRSELITQFQTPFNMAWYPNMIIGVPYDPLVKVGQERYRFYVDHGHFYDPVLLLYLRDFVFAALRQDLRRALTSVTLVGQRRVSEHEAIPRPGMVPARAFTTDQKIAHWLVRFRWRWKARRVLTDRSRSEARLGNRPLSGALFGHTHLPDRYTYRSGGARGMTYVNTGDWAGDSGHGTYTVITQDGVLIQHDWLDTNQRAPHRQAARP